MFFFGENILVVVNMLKLNRYKSLNSSNLKSTRNFANIFTNVEFPKSGTRANEYKEIDKSHLELSKTIIELSAKKDRDEGGG